ncbi:cysteine-tryptophan domain-containing zinc finger protein 7-like isoform X2 [Telopea speciosissima]|uniref:cysteine-tryptophan domain-containing zinc finger protein 7-like isoform X2 n=1 Tax=Telopea speciosissima TaxID=54955 RepID=UPI001CC49069|nr:cysteine-tryptophan domain-containing zinc finger protein 7-like isoform X2 [Telopea speciosissima]
MLSVGSRDGRKGLGFAVGGEMEEIELEEGEACDYQDDNASIDPDVALSYIDEKLQDVLGHFQKDFEGGVSAENLGAKFGGYGSFLPTYQRSPSVWSQPRSPPKVQNNNMQRSPNHLSLENSSVPSSAPFAVRLGPASSSAAAPPVSRVPSVDNSVKRDVCSYPARASVEFSPKHECVNKPVNPNDQKTLKVRIKVGPESTSVKKNAEIYSGLGLDMSPSSSFDDSPAESGGLSPESRNSPDESPTIILQIMTSFPVPGGLLLSPLRDSLLRLSENEKLQRDGRSGPEYKGSQESSGVLVDDSSSVVGISEVVGERKIKSMEKNNRSLEVKNGSGKDFGNDITSLLKKEIDIETTAGRELVSNALKLSLLSSSKFSIGDTAKGAVKAPDISRVANKVVVKEKVFSSDLAKEEALESVPSQDVDVVDKQSAKISSADKVLDLRKDRSKGNKSYDICVTESDATKGRKDLDGGITAAPKQKVGQKATSHEQDGVKRPHVKEQLSSSGKKKSKGSQSDGTPAAEFPKESLKLVSSSASKDKKRNSQAGDYPLKSKSDDVKSRKDLGKTMDNHRDSISESVVEKAEDRVDSLEMPFKDRQNDSKPEFFDKEAHTLSDKPKHRSSGTKVGNQLASEAYPRATLTVAPLMENRPVSDAVHPLPPSVVIKENWVGCDKCQKWRLLPFGMEPTVLPEKWLCSMLNWLPGKNRCDISEEETTRALYAAYQTPVTEGQNNMHSQLDAAASGVTLDEVQRLDQNHHNLSLRALPSSAKKRHGLKEVSSAANHMGSIHFSSSTKKNQQPSAKSRSLNDVNQLPLESNLVNKPVFQQLSKSGDLAVDKRMHKQKEKQKLLESYLDGGVSKHSKTKSKREADQNEYRSSKKVKTEGMYYTDEEWNSDLGIAQPCSSSGLPAKAPGKDPNKFNEHFSLKDSKHEGKDSFPVSAKKLKDRVQNSLDGGAAQDLAKSNKMDAAAKKRKVKEWQENQIYLDPSSGHHFQDSRGSVKEETSESERPKEKKAKASKSEAKESSTSKGDGRTDKKGQVTKILLSGSRDQPVDGVEEGGTFCMDKGEQLGQYRGVKKGSQRSVDVVDSLKKDLGYGQPSMATTSSSSKVSGSRKTKTNFQEVRGSPVESVSSSPLRFSNPEKLISAGRDMLGKDDAMNCGVSVMGSPRRFSDGEGDGGSDRSGMVRKEKTFSVLHHGALESPVLDYQDKEADHTFIGKGNMQVESSSEFENTHLVNGDARTTDRHNRYQNDPWAKDHDPNEERVNNGHYRVNGSLPRKSGMGSSSRSKEKHRSSKSGFDKGKVKLSDSFSEQEDMYAMKSSRYEAETESHDRSPYHQEIREGKYSFQDKCAAKSNKNEKTYSGKKDSVGKWSSESSRRENQSKLGGHEGADVKLGATCSKDGKSNAQQNILQGREGERSSSRFLSDKNDKMDVASGRGKSQFFPHSVDKQETQTRCPRTMPVGASDGLLVDASGSGGDALKVSSHPRKPDNHNGASHSNLRHPTPNGLVGVRDLNAPSPARRDSSGQAAANTALKEAKALKHSADRLKDPGSELERTGLYFEAALKFLYGASLLEPFSNEATRSKNVYGETAMLCGFCAHEYEKFKEMAAAAMAYKCMEVAHMKVIYSKHFTASKDQIELQNALKVVPGESPSSSASDIDNLNNQAAVDKIAVTKDNSSQVAGNHVIVARNRPTFERLLGFTRDVTSAMEASRKSQNAFGAANASLEESQLGEGISFVKRVLEFSFHDVEGLLRLVRLAMQVISR